MFLCLHIERKHSLWTFLSISGLNLFVIGNGCILSYEATIRSFLRRMQYHSQPKTKASNPGEKKLDFGGGSPSKRLQQGAHSCHRYHPHRSPFPWPFVEPRDRDYSVKYRFQDFFLCETRRHVILGRYAIFIIDISRDHRWFALSDSANLITTVLSAHCTTKIAFLTPQSSTGPAFKADLTSRQALFSVGMIKLQMPKAAQIR